MKCSICIATYDRPRVLDRVLNSIFRQDVSFPYEVIVVDDGSPTNDTELVCSSHKLRYRRIVRPASYRNPAVARNVSYRMAQGEVLIIQSDDVVHGDEDTIERLVNELHPDRFVLAHVVNADEDLNPTPCLHPRNPKLVELTGPKHRRPLFFLGSLYRHDLYAVGGNEERFTAPGREDVYFGDCLINGLGLSPVFSSVRGFHLHHDRPPDIDRLTEPSQELYRQLVADNRRTGRWVASGGPWPFSNAPPVGPRRGNPRRVILTPR